MVVLYELDGAAQPSHAVGDHESTQATDGCEERITRCGEEERCEQERARREHPEDEEDEDLVPSWYGKRLGDPEVDPQLHSHRSPFPGLFVPCVLRFVKP